MALIERLMHDSSEPNERWIPVHDFFAAVSEIVSGRLTSAQVQTFLNMTAPDIVDWNAIAVSMPTGTNALATAQKAVWVSGQHAVFLLAESRYPGYDSPTAVRLKLGI